MQSAPAFAEITVFTEPPAATETKHYTPLPAESYQGFLEDEAGTLIARSVTSRRVPAFLAQARAARRWALYPVPDPTALTATVGGGGVEDRPPGAAVEGDRSQRQP
ncbi:MAG TPA: hypothetical protein VGD29_30845 [Actinoplanes sp.]